MNILGIDTSSIVAAVAVLNPAKLSAEYLVNNKKVHSEKLMPIVDRVLKDSNLTLDDIDAVAVSKGPGSFTGIRIGMACAQGIAHACNKPIIGVNTLDGLAYNLMFSDSLICPVINAQRQESYTSLYNWQAGKLCRLKDYLLINNSELAKLLLDLNKEVIILGDAAQLIMEKVTTELETSGKQSNILKAHPSFLMPKASSIASAGLDAFNKGNYDDCFTLEPFYIRKSNAEEKWEERHGGKACTKHNS
ncbi:MAG TPA: tRNA (adenosine(37)-N6)-threonylcarbamoyltransferase complex dimerization subunit type 1 TsaB [Thermoanaerobacterales bacterium]|nr:tRNA (adenosine(37)-N6)-threonylcarbamoyltransferase complex dimerization subunit type 1 TsaB [Thermoanaerobacterales bacterium]